MVLAILLGIHGIYRGWTGGARFFGVYLTEAGILLVHAREGWFVVGGGRNGMEYSVLLISSLIALIVSHRNALHAAKQTSSN